MDPTLPTSLRWSDLTRRSDDRWVAGVASGLAARLGVDPIYVRAAFVVLATVWGLGLVVYLGVWGVTLDRVVAEAPPPSVGPRQLVGLGMIFTAGLLVLRASGFWPGDQVVWPTAGVVFGLATLWDQREVDSRAALLRLVQPTAGSSRARTVVGTGLLMLGLALLGSVAAPQVGNVVLAVMVTGVGLTLVFGPWLWRLAQDLGAERRERIRQEERAEMAAHLHDSVLQTLALIQRTDDRRRMVTLARAQERELRAWLFGVQAAAGDRLSAALTELGASVEADHDVPVEVVTVGDADMDDRLRALVAAAGEAVVNAARHSGAASVSLYAEVGEEAVEVWVSDQGKGFDPAAVPPDRRGISESIVGRMQRHGGNATVTSAVGEGSEVYLRLPRRVT